MDLSGIPRTPSGPPSIPVNTSFSECVSGCSVLCMLVRTQPSPYPSFSSTTLEYYTLSHSTTTLYYTLVSTPLHYTLVHVHTLLNPSSTLNYTLVLYYLHLSTTLYYTLVHVHTLLNPSSTLNYTLVLYYLHLSTTLYYTLLSSCRPTRSARFHACPPFPPTSAPAHTGTRWRCVTGHL